MSKKCPFNGLKDCTKECMAFTEWDGCAILKAKTDLPDTIEGVNKALSAIADAMTSYESGKALEGLSHITNVAAAIDEAASVVSNLKEVE